MKAARFSRFGGPEVLEIVDLPDPHPGPGEVRIAVRAAGVNASDWKKRQGLMDPELPQTLGHEAAGVVDELGVGVTDVAVGDRVFGLRRAGGPGRAGGAVLLRADPAVARLRRRRGLPAAVETATRALDQLGVARGTRSSSTARPGASECGRPARRRPRCSGDRHGQPGQPRLPSLARRRAGRLRRRLVDGFGRSRPAGWNGLDVAGSGVLPELIELAGGPEHVVTVADFAGAQETA